MKKEILYVLAWTLITTSVIWFSTFASNSWVLPETWITNVSKVATQNTDKETNDDNITLPANAITEQKAQEIALTSNVSAKVTWVETEDENGTIVYNIHLDNKKEVKVDVIKGTILKTDNGNEENDSKNENTKENETND